MTRHSKNNTASAFFTSAERTKLAYGTQRQRLGRDSMRRPDACAVCLQTARDPVLCELGHLFCRECILQAIVAQRQKTARQLSAHHAEQAARRAHDAHEVRLAQKRRVAEFERAAGAGASAGEKRPAADSSRTQGAFWVPSKTPHAAEPAPGPPRSETVCPAGAHAVAAKRLVSLRWRRDAQDECVCQVCAKALANTVSGVTALRACGHVACTKCTDELAHDGTLRCPSCASENSCRTDLISLVLDGTGFSGGGGTVHASKYNHAFI